MREKQSVLYYRRAFSPQRPHAWGSTSTSETRAPFVASRCPTATSISCAPLVPTADSPFEQTVHSRPSLLRLDLIFRIATLLN